MKKDNVITFKVDDVIDSRITMAAAIQDKSRSKFITDACIYYIENYKRNPVDFICEFQRELDLLKRKINLGESISESELDNLYAEVNKTWKL